MLGASLHAAVRAHAPAAGERCGELIAKISGVLFETTTLERFATVFHAVYDASTRMLTYANAGHSPPMLIRQCVCTRLDSLTAPVGMLPALPAAQNSLAALLGDWLLIFSDGIPEGSDENEDEFGDSKLLDALECSRSGTAAEVCKSIIDEALHHARGQRQSDDLSPIVAKVL